MNDEDHNNIFDDDDALDYIIFNELSKEENTNHKRTPGCLSSLLLCMTIIMSTVYLIDRFLL